MLGIVKSFMLTEKRGLQLKNWQESLRNANLIFSLPSALLLGVWSIYFYTKFHAVENVPGCNSKFIVDFALAVGLIDTFSVLSSVFLIMYKRRVDQSSYATTKQRFVTYQKVDSVVRLVINVVLVCLKNTMMYFLWLSECQSKSEMFYEAAHYFTIGIVVRVLISSNLLINSFVLGRIGEYILRVCNEARADSMEDVTEDEVSSLNAPSESEDEIDHFHVSKSDVAV